jgi:methylated-DNA-[protein]-cysteine S-methyltransferase
MSYRKSKLFLQKIDSLIDGTSVSAFEKKVLKAVSRVPLGTVTTYEDLARKIGHPKAVRAVGNALSKNMYPIAIPCHRVIKNDGSIGGYAYGKRLKKFLLNIEGVIF